MDLIDRLNGKVEQKRDGDREVARVAGATVAALSADTTAPDPEPAWQMPDEPAERVRLVNEGICPICGGDWGDDPDGHAPDCVNAKTQRNGAGRGWRRSRGRQRHADWRSRRHPLDGR